MSRWFVSFLCSLGLWMLTGQINHGLAPWGVYLFLGGLYVTFAALHLGFGHGCSAILLLGLAIDAVEPVPFGTHCALLGSAHAVIFTVRTRFPREETLPGVFVALLANLGIFLALSLVLTGRHPGQPAAWSRLLADLVFSQVFLALIAPWFFALQHAALLLARVDPAGEPRGP